MKNILRFVQYSVRLAIASVAVRFVKNSVDVSFPRFIKSYSFVRETDFDSSRNSEYRFAIYKNVKGKKALAKLWSGNIKTFAYYSLLNEIELSSIASHMQGRVLKKSNSPTVRIPTQIASVKKKNCVLVLSEYIDGSIVGDFTKKKHYLWYIQSVEFLRGLDSAITSRETGIIQNRTGFHFLLLYPLTLIVAIRNYPHLWKLLVRNIPVVIKSLPELLKRRDLVLTHRDLHGKNLMFSGSRIFLIDFQLAVRTIPEYELICTLASQWHQEGFRRHAIQYLEKQTSQQFDSNILLRGLLACHITHLLTGKNFSRQRFNNYISILHYVTDRPLIIENIQTSGRITKIFMSAIGGVLDLLNRRFSKRPIALPVTHSGYRFVRRLQKKIYPFAVGYYENKKGQTIVIKVWQGFWKNRYYYDLLHEALVYKTLAAVIKRTKRKIPEQLRGIRIPSEVTLSVRSGQLILTREFVNGTLLLDSGGFATQFFQYKRCLGYLRFLSNYLTSSERKIIGEHGVFYFICMYPMLTAVAILKNPDSAGTILTGAITFFKNIPSLLSYETKTLVHGDLHSENIVKTRKDISLLDLEQMMYTVPTAEHVTTIISPKTSHPFREYVKSLLQDEINIDVRLSNSTKVVAIFYATFNLTGSLSAENKKNNLECIRLQSRSEYAGLTATLPRRKIPAIKTRENL